MNSKAQNREDLSVAVSTMAIDLKVLEQAWVSPPKGSVAQTRLPLTFLDVVWIYAGTVERLFFYKLPYSTTHFVRHLFPNLKTSLSLTLQHFFPLAGHLRPPSQSSNDDYEIYFDDGDSVSLILAECDADFEELSGDKPREFAKLQPLVPSLTASGDKSPLIALQVTVFPNHGVCVGITINHVAGDGTSSMNFVHSWAATCRAGATAPVVATPPLHDRNVVVDPNDLYRFFLDLVVATEAIRAQMASNAAAPGDVLFAEFTLGKDHIDKLKRWISAKYEGSKTPFRCSTFVAACAYVWTCLIRSRGWPSDELAYFCFAADARARMEPPVPAAYFGNCLTICDAEIMGGDLVKEDGVRAAAEEIGRAISVLADGAMKGARGWPELFARAASKRPLSIAGSPKFRVYDVDFGWGKPVKVEVTSIRDTGAMSVAESREEQGGVEIGLALPMPEMDRFSSCFAAGLQLFF